MFRLHGCRLAIATCGAGVVWRVGMTVATALVIHRTGTLRKRPLFEARKHLSRIHDFAARPMNTPLRLKMKRHSRAERALVNAKLTTRQRSSHRSKNGHHPTEH